MRPPLEPKLQHGAKTPVEPRALPGRFADRLSASALERVESAAAAGRWEEAVEELITVLYARVAAVTAGERAEMRAVLAALNMAGEQLDTLPVRP